jgi:hypothetical protein
MAAEPLELPFARPLLTGVSLNEKEEDTQQDNARRSLQSGNPLAWYIEYQ